MWIFKKSKREDLRYLYIVIKVTNFKKRVDKFEKLRINPTYSPSMSLRLKLRCILPYKIVDLNTVFSSDRGFHYSMYS